MVTNVFIGLGTVLAGVALLVDTATAYRTTMVVVGLFAAAATVPLAGLRRVPGFAAGMDVHLDPDRVRGPSPLRDRTYLASGRAQLRGRDAVQPDQRRGPAVDRHPHRGARPW